MKLRIEPSLGMATQGTAVYLDDTPIRGVTGITLQAKVNDVWRCTLDMNVIVDGLTVDATTLVNETRIYRSASRWELFKAMLRPMAQR
jgi:hypothetical protein